MILFFYLSALYFCFWIIILCLEIILSNLNFRIENYFYIFLIGFNSLYISIIPLVSVFFINYLFKNIFFKKSFLFLSTIVFTFFYQLYLFLLIYRLRNNYNFDWFFFWYNKAEALATLFRIYYFPSLFFLIILPVLILIIFWRFLKTFNFYFGQKKSFNLIIFILFFLNLFSLTLSPEETKGELINFISRGLSNYQIKGFYFKEYNNYLSKLILNSQPNLNNFSSEVLGEKIFFIHLESVNSFLIDKKNTPNLLLASQRGIFFPQFYSNSVQIIRTQESILCGLPPALGKTIISSFGPKKFEELVCLPKILNQLGYTSLFFKDDSLKFSRSGEFMLKLGFKEVHNEDIMKSGDPETDWGYREDIFYQRVLEYLDKHYQNQKVFVYVAVSSTNHIPFNGNNKFQENLPFTQPKNFKEILANSTFIQDIYFGKLFQELANKKYWDNSSFFIFSDHAWPIGTHPNNIFSEIGAYEENFLIFLLFIPPQNQKFYEKGKVVKTRYSQMDILPTILEILGNKKFDLLGNSFVLEISKDNKNKDLVVKKNQIVLLQPYSGGFITLIKYPEKYLFDSYKNQLLIFDLAIDPLENTPQIFKEPEKYFYLLSDFFDKKEY